MKDVQSFEDARQASLQELSEPVEEVQQEIPVEETPVEEVPEEVPVEEDIISQAPQIAEVATLKAQELDQKLQEALQRTQVLEQQNEQLQGSLQQMSQVQKENIIGEIMTPPIFEFDPYGDEATNLAKQQEYSQKMFEYTENAVMGKMQPFIDQAEQTQRQNEKQSAIQSLSQLPEFTELLPHIESIIAKTPELQDIKDPNTAYVLGYAISKGVNAMNNTQEAPKDLTPEELLEIYKKTPELQKLIERERSNKLTGQQVPSFSATGAGGNVALNIPSSPKNFDDVRKMFK